MRMNRREMLAGLAACSWRPEVWEQEAQATIGQTLYIPKAQLVEDRGLLQDFMDQHPFVTLVTSAPTLRITHIPVLLDRTSGEYGRIFGHISRQNPQVEAIDGSHAAVAVFRGPHGYVSPAWFSNGDSVPTWNFAVVHATGRPRAVDDKSALRSMLGRLIDSFERREGSEYDFSRLPEAYVTSLMERIVGFEMPLESLEGKFKLGQSWSEKDRNVVLEHMRATAGREPSLYEFSVRYLRPPYDR